MWQQQTLLVDHIPNGETMGAFPHRTVSFSCGNWWLLTLEVVGCTIQHSLMKKMSEIGILYSLYSLYSWSMLGEWLWNEACAKKKPAISRVGSFLIPLGIGYQQLLGVRFDHRKSGPLLVPHRSPRVLQIPKKWWKWSTEGPWNPLQKPPHPQIDI